ncbi:hypothetical protein NKH77_55825, partial [Streptomyces sp. M19]
QARGCPTGRCPGDRRPAARRRAHPRAAARRAVRPGRRRRRTGPAGPPPATVRGGPRPARRRPRLLRPRLGGRLHPDTDTCVLGGVFAVGGREMAVRWHQGPAPGWQARTACPGGCPGPAWTAVTHPADLLAVYEGEPPGGARCDRCHCWRWSGAARPAS